MTVIKTKKDHTSNGIQITCIPEIGVLYRLRVRLDHDQIASIMIQGRIPEAWMLVVFNTGNEYLKTIVEEEFNMDEVNFEAYDE